MAQPGGLGLTIGASGRALHARRVRVRFDRLASARPIRAARWHGEGLPLAAVVSVLLWAMIAALLVR